MKSIHFFSISYNTIQFLLTFAKIILSQTNSFAYG